jgi:hypothetical protein
MKLIGSVLLVLLACGVNGQSLRGSKFFQAGIGFRDIGPNVTAYGGMAFSQSVKLQLGGGIGFGTVSDIDYKYVFVDAMMVMTVKEVRRVIFINGLGGISINGDIINKFESSKYDKQFSLNYGVLAGMEAEFKTSRSLSVVIQGMGIYYIKSDFGNLRPNVTLSLRFTL